ncbi:TPA: hypothetical protein ACH3X1_001944 [Trebouxia sp. C0004]
MIIQAFGGAYPPCPCENCPCNGSNRKVKSHGWIKLPRRICCMDMVVYVYASSWRCRGCADDSTHTFFSADAELQLMLPSYIRQQYDFQLSARSGVSSHLCDMILATAAKGQSFQGIQGTIEEMHHKRYYRAELAYVTSLPLIDSAFKKAEQDSNVPSTSKAAPGHANVKSSQSSVYQSFAKAPKARKIPVAGGYGGHVLGSQYMADICKTSARGTAATGYYNRMMRGIKDTTVCADHCHKPSKRIRQNGETALGAFWTCANAQVQIMGQYAVRSKSLAEINMPLTRMHSRLVKLQGTAVALSHVPTLAPSPVPSPVKQKPRSAAHSTQGTLLKLVAQPAAVAGSGPSTSAPSGSSGAAATGKHCCNDCWVHDWWIACVGAPQFGSPGRIDPWNIEKIPTTRTNHKKVCTNKGLFDSNF